MATMVASAYVELSARTSALEAGLAKANAELLGFSKRADATAARSSAAMSMLGRTGKIATVAVAGGLALAMKSAADFDARLSQVKAVTGATASQMDVLRKAALNTSRSAQGFGYTAKDVANAQVELGKAGLSVSQIIGGGMNSALTLAKAGNLELADSAAYVANAMQQFGMSGQQSSQVADALAQAANATTADVSDFGMALVQSGAAAKSAGMSFNQTMTALTALASTGVKGSDAGTSLKTSLIQLIKPMDRQKAAADAVGLSFIGANGKMRDMADISAQLRAKTSSLTQAQRTALFATLAGTDGVRTLLALYNAGPVKIAKYSAELAKQGTAQKQATVMNDNAAGKFKQLMASLQAAGIEIGAALLPPLAALAGGLSTVISKFSAFKPLAYAAAAAVTTLIAAFTINKVVAFAGAIRQAATSIGLLSATQVAGAGAGMTKAASATSLFGKGLARLGPLVALAATPIGALTVGVGLGIAALFAFRNEASSSQRFLAGLGSATTDYKTKVQALNQLLPQQVALVRSATASNRYATEAKKAETKAVDAYNAALDKGRGPRETEQQYQQRIAGLYLAAARARVTTVDATTKSTDATRAAVAAAAKLATSGQQELQAARDRVSAANRGVAASQQFNMSQQAQAKAQSEAATATANLTVVQARYLSGLKADERQLVATRNAVKASSMGDKEKAASLDIVNRAINRTRTEQQKFSAEKAPFKKITVDNKQANRNINNTQALMTGLKNKNVKVNADTAQAKAQLNPLVALLSNIRDKSVTVTVSKRVTGGLGVGGGYRGGYAQHLAGGGTVTGPSGRDVIPAMLTAGEVVLTKKQQALVDAGMSIRDAITSTGGAFARGGYASGGTVNTSALSTSVSNAQGIIANVKVYLNIADVKKAATEAGMAVSGATNKILDNYRKRLAALTRLAEKQQNTEGISQTAINGTRKKIDAVTAAIQKQLTTISKQAQAMTALKEKIADAYATDVLAKFDKATQSLTDSIRREYEGYATTVNGVVTHVTGAFEQIQKDTEASLRNIERTFAGTWTDMAGQVRTGSFKDLDRALSSALKKIDTDLSAALKRIQSKYDMLTPAESQLKALQNAMNATSLQRSAEEAAQSLTEAQKKLADAQMWGDPAMITDAQKAVIAAQRAVEDAANQQTIANLTTQAEAERAAMEDKRQTEIDATNAYYDTLRTNTQEYYDAQRVALQDQLDARLAAERQAGEDRLALAREQMDGRIAVTEEERARLRTSLEGQLEEWKKHFMSLKIATSGNTNSILTKLRTFVAGIERSGVALGSSFADGMKRAIPNIGKVANEMAAIVAKYLELHSPADAGPLSRLDRFWEPFGKTLVSGLSETEIKRAMVEMADMADHAQRERVAREISASAAYGISTAQAHANSNAAVFNLTVTDGTLAGMSREQADRVAREVQAAIERQVSYSIS